MQESSASPREAIRIYILDMLTQLATLARRNGELRIALLLDAVLADDVRTPPRR